MSLVSILALLVLFGVILWAVNTFPWINVETKRVIYVVMVIAIVVWLLQAFGVLPNLGSIRIR